MADEPAGGWRAARELQGIGVSGGTAAGPAFVVGPARARMPRGGGDHTVLASGWPSVDQAIESVANLLNGRAAALTGPAADVLRATATMARDPALAEEIRLHLNSGSDAVTSVHTAIDDMCAALSAVGGRVAERASDLRDVGDRIVACLLGAGVAAIPKPAAPSVIVAQDLSPVDTVGLSPADTIAIVTEEGGPTGHTAILAAELGIPAAVQVAGAKTINPGELVLVDGSTGRITVGSDVAGLQNAMLRQGQVAMLLSRLSGPGRTRDGHPVGLNVNVGTIADAQAAAAMDVDGVGLLRTEFLFMNRDSAPTVNEQVAVYSEMFAAFGGRPVTVRTLDAGSDKPLAFVPQATEHNPALGRRGIRLSELQPELLGTQLKALATAASKTGVTTKVMAPMVATRREARWFADRACSEGISSTGIMVEVPSAALRAHELIAEVDFASIGTNDLAQYTMAADRLEGGLGDLLSPWQPAVLDLISVTAGAGRQAGKPVSVCGEAAGDPLLALVLVGLGVSSLSMAANRVPAVRFAAAQHDLRMCQEMAAAARAEDGPAAARNAVRALCSAELDPLLR